MRKGYIIGIFVFGFVFISVSRVESMETVITTENEVISIENPIIVEPASDFQPIAQEPEFDETVYEELNFVPIDEEPEPEIEIEEYATPTEEIPD